MLGSERNRLKNLYFPLYIRTDSIHWTPHFMATEALAWYRERELTKKNRRQSRRQERPNARALRRIRKTGWGRRTFDPNRIADPRRVRLGTHTADPALSTFTQYPLGRALRGGTVLILYSGGAVSSRLKLCDWGHRPVDIHTKRPRFRCWYPGAVDAADLSYAARLRSVKGGEILGHGLSVGFTTAASLVHELMEARDERRLLNLQKKLARLKLLIVDEPGFVPLSKTGAELLFEVFSQRYERGSILVTTNLPFDEWTEVFGSERLTGALLDRLTHRVHILELNGERYRLKQSRLAATTRAAGDSTDA